MPYPEWKEWRAFYMIEPWGWWNEEVNTARVVAMLHNTHARKAKPLKEFMRDMVKAVLDALKPPPNLADLPPEERKRRIAEAAMKDFGI